MDDIKTIQPECLKCLTTDRRNCAMLNDTQIAIRDALHVFAQEQFFRVQMVKPAWFNLLLALKKYGFRMAQFGWC